MIQVTDQRYLDQINEPFRGSFSAEVKLFFKGGTRTFTDEDIFTISENETANIVADENPTQSTEITLSNYNHEFDINGTSGYFRDISDGIECQYRFGFHVLDEDGSDDIVWLDWKRRWCSGEASLAEKQVTFTVADVFSTNDDNIEGYMSSNYGLIVTNVFNKSTYPQQENGIIGVDFDTDLTNTVMYYQPTYTAFNEIIQSVAFASGKQFYIDHKGVVHIDDDRTTPTGVHLGIGDYFEDNEAGKEKKVKRITVSYYVPEDSTVDARPDFVREMNGTGESVTVSNDFICSLEDGNRVMSYLVNYYDKRGTFECTFRGDPRLEPLDVITIDILNSDETVQTVTGTIISVENTYDGTFESTIECRYVTTDTTDDIASITGAENFVYPLDSNTPSPTSVTLTCTTSINNPTKYVWEYYNMVTSAWTQIGTGSTLTIPYNTEWLSDDVTTTFRCTVDDSVSASVGIKRVYTHATYTYLGIQQTAPSNPTTGDYYLAPSGLVYLWNGQEWVTTTRSDLLINAVADGKTLTGIEDTPLGQLIASMQGADGQPGADGRPGEDGQPGTDGVSITGVTSYYLATSQSSGVTTETTGWTTTVQTMTETNKYLWTYQVTSFSDGHTETSTPYITGVYGDKGEQGADGAPAKSLILTADSYSFHTDAEGNVKPNQVITLTVQKQNVLDDIVWTDNKNINVPTNTLTYQFNSSVGEEVTPINELKGLPYVGTDGEGYKEYIFGSEENIAIITVYSGEEVVSNGSVGDADISIPDGTYSVWPTMNFFRVITSTTPPRFYYRYKTSVTDYYHVLPTNMNGSKFVGITPDSNGYVSYVGNLDWIQGEYLAAYVPYAIFASAGTTTGISAVNTQPVLVDIAKNQDIFTAKGLTTDEEIKEYLDSIPYEDFASRDSVESITYPDNLIPNQLTGESAPTGGYLANSDGTIVIASGGSPETVVVTDGKVDIGNVTGIDDGTYTGYVCVMTAIVVPQIINHKVYIRFEGDGDNILAAYRLDSNFIFAGYKKTGNIFSLVENLDTSYVSGEESFGMVYLTHYSFNTDTSTRTTRAEKPVIVDITANESFFMEHGLLTDEAIREYLDSIPYEKFGTTETIDTPTSQINPALDGTPTIFTVTAGDLSDSVQIGYVQDGEQGEAGSGDEMVTLVPSTTTYQVSSRDVVQTETVITIEARIKGADITGTKIVYPENFAKDATPDEGQAYDPDFAYMGTDLEHAQIDGHVTESYEGTINWHDSTQGYYVNVPLSDLQDYTEGLASAGLGYYINKKDIVDTVMSHKMYWRWNTDIITDGDIKLVSTLTYHRDNTGTFTGGILVLDYDKTNQCVSAISDFNLTSDTLWWYISLIAGKDATARGDVVGKQFSYPVIVDITANQQLFTDKGLTTDAEIKAYLNGVAYEDFGKDILIDSNLLWEVTPSEADGYTTGKNTTMITVTIPVGSNLTGFAVKCTVTDVGEDTVYINSVAVGEPTIRFFEQRTSPPTTSDNNGERFITGDYYVTSDGVPMMYDEVSDSWRQPNNGDKYYDQIMTNVGNWWLSKGNEITTTVAALYGYFRTIYSNNAIIDQLSVAGIRLQEGGIIQSTVTLPDGTVRGYEPGDGETYGATGFYLSADGTAEFYNMSAFGIFAKGSFQADAMVTGEGTSAITQSNLYSQYQSDWVSQESYQQITNTSSYTIGDVYSMNISPDDTYAFWTSVSFSDTYKNVYAYAMGIGDATVSATRLSGIENAIEALNSTDYERVSRSVAIKRNGSGYQAVVVGGVSSNHTQRITVIDTTSATATATTHEYTRGDNPVQFATIPIFTDTQLLIYNAGSGIDLSSFGNYAEYQIGIADLQSDGGNYSFSWGQSGGALWGRGTEFELADIQNTSSIGGVYDAVNGRVWIWFVGNGKMFPTEFISTDWRRGARYRGNDYNAGEYTTDFNETKTSTYNDYIATDNGMTVITYGNNTAWEVITIGTTNKWIIRSIDFGSTRYGFMGWDGTYIYGKNLSTNMMYRGTKAEWNNGNQTSLGYTISSNIVGKYLVDGDILSWSSNVKRTTHGQRMDNIISFFSQLLPKINPSTMSHMPESEPLASVTACSGTVKISGNNENIVRMGCSSSTLTIDTDSGSHVYKSGVLYDDTETVEITELTILAKAASVNTKDILPQSSNTYDIGASNNYYRTVYCDTLFVDEIGSGSNKVSRIYATYIGESSDKVSTIYTTNLYLGTYNKSSTGYTPLPNGLLLQWGYMSGNTDGKTWDIIFPRTFSTLYCLTGGLVAGYSDRTYEHMNFHNDFSRTGFGFNTYDAYQCFWMALGTI